MISACASSSPKQVASLARLWCPSCFVPLIQIAREKGISGYPGEGTNRWSAVHRLDAATLFRLGIEAAPSGARLHAAGEEAISSRRIAEAIGMKLGVPVQSIPWARVNGALRLDRPVLLDGQAGVERQDAGAGRLGRRADGPHSG